MRLVGLVISFLLIVVVVAFVLLNRSIVNLNYLLGGGEYPLAVVTMAALSLGILITLLLMGIPLFKAKCSIHLLKKRVHKLEQELLEYRDQVAKDV
jgi:uncharacterized membrane protein YciS (DUF1049 family)